MYWDGRLVIPALQRFYSSQQVAPPERFPLVLLQAKAVRFSINTNIPLFPPTVSISSPSGEGGETHYGSAPSYILQLVSISSPSGEGGEYTGAVAKISITHFRVSISSPSGEGGESRVASSNKVGWKHSVSISSPSGEGGELNPYIVVETKVDSRCFH
jgi:hypothetical protein